MGLQRVEHDSVAVYRLSLVSVKGGCFSLWYTGFSLQWLLLLQGFPHSSVGKESTCNAGDPGSIPGLGRSPGVGKISWRRHRLPTPVFLGFPCGSAGKEPACNVGDLGLFPGLGRSPGERKGYPLWYSGLENSMDYTVHGAANSWARLSDFHFLLLQSTCCRACGLNSCGAQA